MLHETVLAGVVRNDCENTAWRQPVSERWERRLQSTQLVVHSDAHRLKDAREIAGSGARAQHSADRANQVIARLERPIRSEEHTSELQSPCNLVCRLLLEKKKLKQVHLPL